MQLRGLVILLEDARCKFESFWGRQRNESRFFCNLDTENCLSEEGVGFWHCDLFTVILLLSHSGILKNVAWFGPCRYDGWQHILQWGRKGWSVSPRLYPKATVWCWPQIISHVELVGYWSTYSLRIAKDK